jgi:hypothetical protein
MTGSRPASTDDMLSLPKKLKNTNSSFFFLFAALPSVYAGLTVLMSAISESARRPLASPSPRLTVPSPHRPLFSSKKGRLTSPRTQGEGERRHAVLTALHANSRLHPLYLLLSTNSSTPQHNTTKHHQTPKINKNDVRHRPQTPQQNRRKRCRLVRSRKSEFPHPSTHAFVPTPIFRLYQLTPTLQIAYLIVLCENEGRIDAKISVSPLSTQPHIQNPCQY